MPLTRDLPKPLIDIDGRPVIEYTLIALKKAGVRSVIINLHYLGDAIRQRLGDGSGLGLDLHYSYEPEIQGTAGALLWARSLLDGPFYLINSDILFDADLSLLPRLLHDRDADAVMVLYKAKQGQEDIANVYLDGNGYVKSLFKPYPGTVPYLFTGIQFLKPTVMDYIPRTLPRPSTTLHMYPEMLRNGRPIAGLVHEGLWLDIGSMDRLKLAHSLYASQDARADKGV